jgi:uncharacterized membrane protein YfcA
MILFVGLFAGFINAIVGSGGLVTFPTLLFIGVPPLTANVTNNLGTLPGVIASVISYRRLLRLEEKRFLLSMALAGGAGGLSGSILLLGLPRESFEALVPLLLISATLLVIFTPTIQKFVGRAREMRNTPTNARMGAAARVGVFFTMIYGGYFGAGQGVMVLGVLGIAVPRNLQRLNGLKNIVVLASNSSAALVFVLFAPISWPITALLATGSLLGGFLGAHYGKKLPERIYRAVIVAVGLIATIAVLLR